MRQRNQWGQRAPVRDDDTYTFSPTLLLNTTVGFTRGTTRIDAYNSSQNPNPLSALGFPSYLEQNGFDGVPAIFIGAGYYSAGYTSAGNNPYGELQARAGYRPASFLLTKIHGSHELKFGFEGRVHQQNYIQTNAPFGIFSFDNTAVRSVRSAI